LPVYCRYSRDEQAREAVSQDELQESLKSLCRSIGWMDQVQLFIADGYLAKK
jgi:DNA invertase Pin-like site-specific DNA recombinase